MKREKLREIACALLPISGVIAGGAFSWTDASLRLFARINAGCAIDETDLCALDRACEVAEAIARVLHDVELATRFENYRAALSRAIPIDVQELLWSVQKVALRRRRKGREKAERYFRRLRIMPAPAEGE